MLPILRRLALCLCPVWVLAPATAADSTVLILRCHDGDTCQADRFILPGRDRVRLRNADTPEIDGRCPREREMAIAARDLTISLAVGQQVGLLDVKTDKYPKRVDAYVRLPDGRDLGDVLIDHQLARPYDGGRRSSWCP